MKKLSEAEVLNIVKLEAAKKNIHLWRNNVGAVHTDDGRFLRYGLANESFATNKIIKSGDLIGIRPVLITPDLIGVTIGQFVSRETKNSAWKYSATEREKAQLAWAVLINKLGGDAAFATGEGSL